MKTFSKILIAILATSAAACGGSNGSGSTDGTPTPAQDGSMELDYAFSGAEAPLKVNLLVLDGGVCDGLAFHPSTGIVRTIDNLPLTASVNVDSIAAATGYVVTASGVNGQGERVAYACEDHVTVSPNMQTQVHLDLVNAVNDVTGIFQVHQDMNVGLPTGIQDALHLVQDVCAVLPGNLCHIVSDVSGVLTDLQVDSQWTYSKQADGTFMIHIAWQSVQGVDSTGFDLADGGLTMAVPAATGGNLQGNLQLQYGNLALFVIEKVLNHDLGILGQVGAQVTNLITNTYVAPLPITGTLTMTDDTDDGRVDLLAGDMGGHIQIGNWGHDVTAPFTATR